MRADEVLVFPAGVRSQHPFSAPIDAVTWLCNAADGAYGPMSDCVLGIAQWHVPVESILRPLYPEETPYPIPEHDPDSRWGPYYVSESGRPFGAPALLVTEYGPARIGAWPADPGYDTDAASVATCWRTAIGGEVLTRGYFDAAEKPDRRAAAQVLGAYEALTESTGAALVTFVNRWICTAWRDALNGPVAVVPDPTPGHAYTTFTRTAVGTVRIGVVPTPQ